MIGKHFRWGRGKRKLPIKRKKKRKSGKRNKMSHHNQIAKGKILEFEIQTRLKIPEIQDIVMCMTNNEV